MTEREKLSSAKQRIVRLLGYSAASDDDDISTLCRSMRKSVSSEQKISRKKLGLKNLPKTIANLIGSMADDCEKITEKGRKCKSSYVFKRGHEIRDCKEYCFNIKRLINRILEKKIPDNIDYKNKDGKNRKTQIKYIVFKIKSDHSEYEFKPAFQINVKNGAFGTGLMRPSDIIFGGDEKSKSIDEIMRRASVYTAYPPPSEFIIESMWIVGSKFKDSKGFHFSGFSYSDGRLEDRFITSIDKYTSVLDYYNNAVILKFPPNIRLEDIYER